MGLFMCTSDLSSPWVRSLTHINDFASFQSSSVVVPLIATLGINDKVTFLEKGGTG